MALRMYLSSSLFIICTLWTYKVQGKITDGQDSTLFLQAERLEISVNSFKSKPNFESFNAFSNKFNFGNRFITGQLNSIEELEFNSNVSYSGFQISFRFKTHLFGTDQLNDRSKFTASFESGTTTAHLYQLSASDTIGLSYDFTSDIFRLSTGYRYFLTKKSKKRLRFHVGIELIHEFNISASILEKQHSRDFLELRSERRLFAEKKYAFYFNFPFGIDYRMFKRAIIFLYFNNAIGIQNIDPFINNILQGGTRFGFSLII